MARTAHRFADEHCVSPSAMRATRAHSRRSRAKARAMMSRTCDCGNRDGVRTPGDCFGDSRNTSLFRANRPKFSERRYSGSNGQQAEGRGWRHEARSPGSPPIVFILRAGAEERRQNAIARAETRAANWAKKLVKRWQVVTGNLERDGAQGGKSRSTEERDHRIGKHGPTAR